MFALNKFMIRLILEFIIPSHMFNLFSKKMYEISNLRSVIATISYLSSRNRALLVL